MKSVCGFRPGCGCAYHARPDGSVLALGHAPLIHRLIWLSLLYCPGPAVGRRCILEPLSLCLDNEVVRVGVRHKWPLYLAHVVAGLVQQHGHVLMVLARGPRHQIVAVVNASDNSFLGVGGHILRQLGPGSICH